MLIGALAFTLIISALVLTMICASVRIPGWRFEIETSGDELEVNQSLDNVIVL